MFKEQEKAKVHAIAIPDPILASAGISGLCIGNEKFAVFASRRCTKNKKPINETNVHLLRTDSILFNGLLRKLINESCGLFDEAQKMVKLTENSNVATRVYLLELSKKYRCVLRDCVDSMKGAENVEISEDILPSSAAIFYHAEIIWHLTEILHIGAIPGDLVLPFLIQWVRFHYSHWENAGRELAKDLSQSGENSSMKEDVSSEYWRVVFGLLIQANVDGVRSLLQLHPLSYTDPFQQIDKILCVLPTYNFFGEERTSTSEFALRWKMWQKNAIAAVKVTSFDSQPNLKLLAAIVCGEKSAEVRTAIKSHCITWYQYMTAMLAYVDPTVKFYQLAEHVRKYATEFAGWDSLTLFDTILLNLFECDLHGVVEKMRALVDGGWLATHLTNVLTLCGKLTRVSSTDKRPDGEAILSYGTLLMSHKSLWQVGLTYLDHCGREGEDAQRALLPAIPADNEGKILKLIAAAKERNFEEIAKGICRVEGMKCVNRNRLGKALEWAVRAQDSAFATALADKFLRLYLAQTSFNTAVDEDMLRNLGAYAFVCDRLTFLGKYCEFRRLCAESNFKEAALYLIALLVSKIAPKFFWLTLLTHAVPLLEHDNEDNSTIFTVEQTHNLSYVFMEWLDEGLGKDDVPVVKDETSQQVKMIRMALIKNLARASMFELATCKTDAIFRPDPPKKN